MQVKMIMMLGVLLIAALLIIGVDDIAIAKKNKSLDDFLKPTIRPVPTPRPVPVPGNRSSVTPTPAPSPAPVPSAAPAPEPVSQPASMAIQYTWQNSWPGYDATPVPQNAPSQNTMAVSSSLSDDAIPASPALPDIGLSDPAEQAYPGMNLRVFVLALMGFACICYLAYLGYVMIKR